MAKTFTKEKDVKATVKALLTKHNYFWWMPPANGFGKVGVSDFNALRAGVFIAVETKFGGNGLTHHQKAYLQSVTAEGGFGFVVNEKRIETFTKWLEAFDRAAEAAAAKKPVDPSDGALMLDCIREMTDDFV